MRYHESKSTRPWERVYLVVSDLKLMLASRHKLEKALDNENRGPLVDHSDVFLNPKEIDVLREKHWAIEVDGVYYELDRDKKDRSFFSSRRRVGHFDRRVAARIFLGTTHFERRALKSIGRAVIATQVTYELTRNNCHRFVRIFTSLTLCRNHPAHTIPELPFGVEEHLASRKAKALRDSSVPQSRNIFRRVGAGVAWTLFENGGQAELRRTVRTIEQKTFWRDDIKVPKYPDEFTNRQEQTSYISELDPKSLRHLDHCHPIRENPYTCLLRFEKVAQIRIEPHDRSDIHYHISSVSHGMVSGPHGGDWSPKGSFERVNPVELMRDRSNILRDGDGKRLEWPEQDWRKILAGMQDSFLHPPTRKRYDRSTPKTELLKSVGPFKDHSYLVDMARWIPWVGGAGWMWQLVKRHEKKKEAFKALEAIEAEKAANATGLQAAGKVDEILAAEDEEAVSEVEHDTDAYAADSEPEIEEQSDSEESEPEPTMLEKRATELDVLFDNFPLRMILQSLD